MWTMLFYCSGIPFATNQLHCFAQFNSGTHTHIQQHQQQQQNKNKKREREKKMIWNEMRRRRQHQQPPRTFIFIIELNRLWICFPLSILMEKQ